MSRILEVGVKIFLQNTEGEFLILKRKKPFSGEKICRWDIPGGRIKPGEPHITALKRECKEETGLTIKKIYQVFSTQDILKVPGRHTIRITYLGFSNKTNKIKVNLHEHSTYRWVALKELKKLRHDPLLKPLITKLEKEEK